MLHIIHMTYFYVACFCDVSQFLRAARRQHPTTASLAQPVNRLDQQRPSLDVSDKKLQPSSHPEEVFISPERNKVISSSTQSNVAVEAVRRRSMNGVIKHNVSNGILSFHAFLCVRMNTNFVRGNNESSKKLSRVIFRSFKNAKKKDLLKCTKFTVHL